jgi:hypothetical protein
MLLLLSCHRLEPVYPPPVAGTITLSPESPSTDSILTATVTGATGDLSYSWFVDNTLIASTGTSLDGYWFNKGQLVRVEAVAEREGVLSEPVSAEVTIVNTAPGAPTLAIVESEEGFSCVASAEATDKDNDSLTTVFAWVSGDYVSVDPFLSLENSARGSQWDCVAQSSDGEAAGPPVTISMELSGPVPGQYSFTAIMDLIAPSDLVVLPDDTMLVSSLMGTVTHINPREALVEGELTLNEPDDLISIALDPDYGDGLHSWLYTWTNHSCLLTRYDLGLRPLTISNPIILAEAECNWEGGHAGGDLLWWTDPEGNRALYLGIGPTMGASPQDDSTPGQKLLSFAVAEDGTVSPGTDSTATWPYIAATGLRNPWRLADCGLTICISDAGSDYYEEINIYSSVGMNFGYPRSEGPEEGAWDEPLITWSDDDLTNPLADKDGPGRTGFMNAPMVGVRLSDKAYGGRLDKTLLYADVYDGWVRGAVLEEDGSLTEDLPIASLQYLSSMVEDSTGTVWATNFAKGLYRLDFRADRPQVGPVGQPLSEANPSGQLYSVQYPLWSNGADKYRMIEVPAGTTIDTSNPEAWAFPDGTRLWKSFFVDDLPVETRLLEKRDGAWLSGVYIWEGDDAYLSDGTRQDLILPSGESYTVPSQFACWACHAATMGQEAPLGVQAYQLGDEGLALLAGMLDTAPGPAPVIDTGDPLEDQIMGYLAGNCSYCHQPMGTVSKVSMVTIDLRWNAEESGLLTNHAEGWNANAWADDGMMLVEPGDPDNSALVGILEAMDMPPLAVWKVDEESVALIREWIEKMEPQ